ncbi:MAG: channel protein hemolysin family [Bacteroidota bacterium]|nr:channel protein hemolysin family [Bacteroidota bacterium]
MKVEIKKEIANTITHGVGILFFLTAIPFLLYKACHVKTIYLIACVVFAVGLIMVYSSSTLYHAIQNENVKRKLRVYDHISIYMLIGGSYTPFIAKYLVSPTASTFLTIIWCIIALCVALKFFFTGKYDFISTLSYLGLGWMAVFIGKPMLHDMPSNVMWLLIFGGLSYSLGVIFYAWKKFTYHHAVWHCFVLCGSVTHFYGVWYALGK